jgi:hypothetical protein
LSVISFILAVLDTSLKEDEEEEISGFLEFVRRFYRRWSPLNRLDESHACSLGDVEIIVLQHHLRFFSAKEKYRPLQEALTPPFLVLHRVREEFPAYSGRSNRPLFEKRISLFCIAKKYPGGQHELPEFHIVVLKDGYIPSLDWGTEEFWSKNNMTVRGPPAAFQLFLAVIYEIIRFWEREWIACIKGLDGCITVQVSCRMAPILEASIPNSRTDG